MDHSILELLDFNVSKSFMFDIIQNGFVLKTVPFTLLLKNRSEALIFNSYTFRFLFIGSIEIKRMPIDHDAKCFSNGLFDFLYSGGRKTL